MTPKLYATKSTNHGFGSLGIYARGGASTGSASSIRGAEFTFHHLKGQSESEPIKEGQALSDHSSQGRPGLGAAFEFPRPYS